jgi:hypothetical protein
MALKRNICAKRRLERDTRKLANKAAPRSNGCCLGQINPDAGVIADDHDRSRIARFIKHADDRPVRARARAVLRVRDGAADCVGSCIPDRAVLKPIADQIKAVPLLAGTDLVSVLGDGGGHFHPAVCISPKLVC